eukprot:2963555-Pleurochrysis_carterae.AAC.2
MAQRLRWSDADIVEQAEEGGQRRGARGAGDLRVDDSTRSPPPRPDRAGGSGGESGGGGQGRAEWVSIPVSHLPFVLCRLQPRVVVMQARNECTSGATAPTSSKIVNEKPGVIT